MNEISKKIYNPLYFQVREKIKSDIENGILEVDQQLLPENELALKYKVSRRTIRVCLSLLEKQGYVLRLKGKGTFVVDNYNQIKNIFVIIPDFGLEGHYPCQDVLSGILSCCNDFNMWVRVNRVKDIPELIEKKRIGNLNIDGMILFRSLLDNDSFLDSLEKANIPFVVEGRNNKRFSSVDIDDESGLIKAIDSLIELGHQRIGLFCYEDYGQNKHYANRYECFKKILQQKKLFNKKYCFPFTPYLFDFEIEVKNLYKDSLKLLQKTDLPTAFISINDTIALIFMQRAIQQGYKIPDDFSVIGFDDSPSCTRIIPSLSSIKQDYFQLGCTAVEVLHHLISTSKGKIQVLNELELISRDSMGSCRSKRTI